MLSLVNVISHLMWPHFRIPFTTAYYIKTIGYCYHSANVITFGLAQSDHIKRLLLYVYVWQLFALDQNKSPTQAILGKGASTYHDCFHVCSSTEISGWRSTSEGTALGQTHPMKRASFLLVPVFQGIRFRNFRIDLWQWKIFVTSAASVAH